MNKLEIEQAKAKRLAFAWWLSDLDVIQTRIMSHGGRTLIAAFFSGDHGAEVFYSRLLSNTRRRT